MKAVEARNLKVQKGKHEILRGNTFSVDQGKIVGLLGPSGAGKTTLIRTIVGLQKISSGAVRVLSHPSGSAILRGKIGYMAQSSAIYDDLTVRQNLYYFASVLGETKASADEIINQVELADRANQVVASLSGGQRTRVSLAIALLGQPPLLILDEPTVGLDPRLRKDLWAGFRSLAQAETTILVSSHVMDEAVNCDELLLISDGKILAQETPDRLCKQTNSSSVEEAFLKLTEPAK